jgi:hypothetical protein
MKIRYAATPLVIGAAAGVLAGCHSSPTTVKAKASAAATSTTGQQARSDLQTLAKSCPMPSNQLSVAGWQTYAKCVGIPKGQWPKAGNCIIVAVEHGGKLPSDKATRDQKLISEAFPCVQKYQAKK